MNMPTKAEVGTKKVGSLRPHQDELQHLSQLAGIYMNPRIFRIIIEMLNMGVHPETIYLLFKKSLKGSRRSV